MKYRSQSRTIALVIAAAAAAVFCFTLARAVWYAPDSEIEVPQRIQPPVSASSSAISAAAVASASTSLPVRLEIPSIGIDANVQDVGITQKGSMGTPNNFTDVAWYKYGPMPGQVGSSVIDGHVDNGLGLDGVFKHLNEVQIGDSVYVDEKDGQRLHFIVQSVQLYPYQDVPTDGIFNSSDAAHLNLITCDGAWVQGDRTYDHRLVIYSTLAS